MRRSLTNVGSVVELEIYADVVCPWCYIGKARLEKALATFDGEVIIRMRPFQLDPHAPTPGQPLLPWLGQRFGGPDRARQVMAHVTAVAETEGLDLDFDRAIIANTFDAHRLLWFADRPEAVVFGAGPDTQPDLANALYRAHFTDGLDLSSTDVLVSLAEELELDSERVWKLLTTTEGTADVRAHLARADDLGISSVPTFVAAGRYAVSGAQESATLKSFLDEVVRREGLGSTPQTLIPGQRHAEAYEDDPR
jgi:predicted DsbA family dithiol-disulfide isomerase